MFYDFNYIASQNKMNTFKLYQMDVILYTFENMALSLTIKICKSMSYICIYTHTHTKKISKIHDQLFLAIRNHFCNKWEKKNTLILQRTIIPLHFVELFFIS